MNDVIGPKFIKHMIILHESLGSLRTLPSAWIAGSATATISFVVSLNTHMQHIDGFLVQKKPTEFQNSIVGIIRQFVVAKIFDHGVEFDICATL